MLKLLWLLWSVNQQLFVYTEHVYRYRIHSLIYCLVVTFLRALPLWMLHPKWKVIVIDEKWWEMTYSSGPDCTWLLWHRLTPSARCTHTTWWDSSEPKFGSFFFLKSMKKWCWSRRQHRHTRLIHNSLSVAVVANRKLDLLPNNSFQCFGFSIHQLKMGEEWEMEPFWWCLTHLWTELAHKASYVHMIPTVSLRALLFHVHWWRPASSGLRPGQWRHFPVLLSLILLIITIIMAK